jgi:hypothetical protein
VQIFKKIEGINADIAAIKTEAKATPQSTAPRLDLQTVLNKRSKLSVLRRNHLKDPDNLKIIIQIEALESELKPYNKNNI